MFGFLGSIIGAGIASSSSKRTNAANIAQSKWATKFNAKEARLAEQRAWHRADPAVMRRRLERAGYNPNMLPAMAGTMQGASHTGQAVFSPLQDNGAAIGNMIAGGFASLDEMQIKQQQLDLAKSELEFQRQQLQDQSRKMSMTPRSGGLYGGAHAGTRQSVSNMAPDLLPRGGRGTDPRNTDTDELGSTAPLAPGREVKVEPYSTGAGLIELNSALTFGHAISVPGSDGEPWGIDELGTALVFGIPQMLWKETKRRAKNDVQMVRGAVQRFNRWQRATERPRPKPSPMGSMSDPTSYWFYQNQWGQ